MATELDGAFERNPYAVFTKVGDTVVGMLVDKKTAPDYEIGTKTQKVDPKTGKGKEQDIVTVIALEGTTASVREGDTTRAAKVGELVTLFLSGMQRFEFYQAKNKLGALRVSDVVGVRFDATEDTGKGNPLKRYKVALRRSKAEESALADRAEVEHKRVNGVVIEEASSPAPAADDSDDDGFFG